MTTLWSSLLLVSAFTVLLWPFLERLPLGRLPGDIDVVENGVRFRLPWVTCLALALAAFGLSSLVMELPL